jgi:hypothetical protein
VARYCSPAARDILEIPLLNRSSIASFTTPPLKKSLLDQLLYVPLGLSPIKYDLFLLARINALAEAKAL